MLEIARKLEVCSLYGIGVDHDDLTAAEEA